MNGSAAGAQLEMRGHASVLSPANPLHLTPWRTASKAEIWLDAHFEAGELTTVDVIGNGEVNYFEVPEGNAQSDGSIERSQMCPSHV